MTKIIIGIHGLANKPPKQTLETWWQMITSDPWKVPMKIRTNLMVICARLNYPGILSTSCKTKHILSN